MRDNDKRKSTTFQRIMENNPENIFAQTNGSIKKRHGGLAIKLSKVENEVNDEDSTNSIFDTDEDSLSDDSDEKFYDAVEEHDDKDLLNNVNSDSIISKKYMYNCVTILGDKTTVSKQNKKNGLNQKLRSEEERKVRIDFLIETNDVIFNKIRNELEVLHKSLEQINKYIFNTTTSEEIRINKTREYAEIEYKIKENKKQLEKLIKDNAKNLEYKVINNNNIEALKSNISKLEVEIQKKLTESKKIRKIQKKEEQIRLLDTKINAGSSNQKQLISIMSQKLKLEKEIEGIKKEDSKLIKKIYEEIFPFEDDLCFITTLVHNDESITEEVIYFEIGKDDELQVWTQIKKYNDVNEYKNDHLLFEKISDNKYNVTFSKKPIKKFILDLEIKKNKILKSEWIICISLALLSITLLAIPVAVPALVPIISTILWEKTLVSIIGIGVAWIVNKGIWTLASEKTKKVESWMKQNFFSWMGKIKIFNVNKKFSKTKEEIEVKNNINKLIENLKSDKVETKLSAKFSILKDLLNYRKDNTIDKIMSDDFEAITKTKKVDIILTDTNFDAPTINSFGSEPVISREEISRLGPSIF